MLVGAAKRLRDGHAVGVDVWRAEDQTGNRRDATLENAHAEGVADKVSVTDGDARDLPLPDAAFGAVVSSLVLHNISERSERDGAVREIARVLKPGGRVALIDFQHTDEYARVLSEVGVEEVTRSALHFLLYPPVRVVTGRKPERAGRPGR